MLERERKTVNPAGNPKLRSLAPEQSFARFENLTEKLLKVPKDEVDDKRAEREQAREHKED
jgi:hypothetical protein